MARTPADFKLWLVNAESTNVETTAATHSVPNPCKNPKMAAPDAADYWQLMIQHDPAMLTVTMLCLLSTIIVIILYCVKFYYIRVYVSSFRRSSKMAWVAAIFPVTSVIAFIGVCMPRSIQVIDIFIYLYFTRCLFTFVQLIADYFGGELEMAKFLKDEPVALNTLPCCCCCIFLPKKMPTRDFLRKIGILVYQVAILPPIIFFITAVVWVDQDAGISQQDKFLTVLFPLLSVLQVVSILVASYGTQIFTRMAAVSLQDYCIKTQMRFVQLMIVLYNIQGDVFSIAASSLNLIPCDTTLNLTATDRASLWNHFLLIFEILILAIMAVWFLRPAVNATFDLHASQLQTHAMSRKQGIADEDYYIHEDELAENISANASRNRRILVSHDTLDTDSVTTQQKLSAQQKKRPSFASAFAPKPRLSLYGPGPNFEIKATPPVYYDNDNFDNNSNKTKNSLSVISSSDIPIINIGPPGYEKRFSESQGGRNSSVEAMGAGGRRKSLLEVQYLPRRMSEGPWLKRLPSNNSATSLSADPGPGVRQAITSISEEMENEDDTVVTDDDIVVPDDDSVVPHDDDDDVFHKSNSVTSEPQRNGSVVNQISVHEYLI